MSEQRRLPPGDPAQRMLRPPAMPPEPLVLPHDPPTQGEVEVSEDRIQRGLVVVAELPDPAPNGGIEHVRHVRQGLVGAPGTPPPTHFLAVPLRRRPAHRRTEAHEVGSASSRAGGGRNVKLKNSKLVFG